MALAKLHAIVYAWLMTATARLLHQRSRGEVKLRMERSGIAILRESGAAKVRLPRGSSEAILINTSGGLAGGDTFTIDVATGPGAELVLTSQAAERVYRTLGPPAVISVNLSARAKSKLLWLPLETILFNGAALDRKLTVTLENDADFLALEAVMLGRKEMGEVPGRLLLKDRWRIYRDDKLIHADNLHFEGGIPATRATLNGAMAFATLVHISKSADVELGNLRDAIGADGGASAWNGKLIARIIAADGFHLRKAMLRALNVLIGASSLPRIWNF